MALSWNLVTSLVGPSGLSTLSGSGAPTSTTGKVGDIYVDTQNARLYAAKTASGWASTYATLVGPVTQQVLPNDLTGNSLTLSPVSGDTNAVALALKNTTGTQFQVDQNGNTTGNTATFTALTSTGIAKASTFVGAVGSLNNPAFSFNTQIDTGVYLPTTSTSQAVMALVVNATQALSLTAAGISIPGALNVSGQTTLGAVSTGALTAASLVNTGSGTAAGFFSSLAGTASAPAFSFSAQKDSGLYLPTTSASAAVLALAVNGAQALALSKAGINVPGTLTVAGATQLAALSAAATTISTLTASGAGSFGGLLTIPNLTISGSGGVITFPDGTTQATAAKFSSATFVAGSNGTVSAPAFTYAGQTDTGAYLATASSSSAILGFSVNATQALALSKTGAQVPGTLSVSGATTLGATSFGNATGSGTLSISGAANLGATTLSSLNVTGNASVQGTTTLQAAFVTSMSNSGTSTATAFTISQSSGKLTFGDGTTQTTAAVTSNPGQASIFSASANGTAAAPAFTFTAQADTGVYLAAASTSAAVLALSVNGTQALSLNKGGVTVPGSLTASGNASVSGTLSVSGNTTLAALSAGATSVSQLSDSGNATIGGTLSVSGSTTLAALTVSSLTNTGTGTAAGLQSSIAGTVSAPSITYSAQTDTGIYLATTSTSAAVLGLSVNATQVLSLAKTGVTIPVALNVSGATALGALSASSLTVSGTSALGAASVSSMSNSGTSTAAAFTISTSGGKLTFGDGTTQTTAATSPGQANLFSSSSNGTVSAPAYTFNAQTDTGMYLPTASTSAAVLALSVNATQALSLSKSGINVPGTLSVGGNTTLAGLSAGATSVSSFTDSGNASISGTLSVSGNTTLAALSVSSLTNTGVGTAAGLQSSIAGTASAPSISYSAQTDSGIYLATTSASAAVLGVSVNATQVLSLAKSGVTLPLALNVSGASTLAGLTASSLTVSGTSSLGQASVSSMSNSGTSTAAAFTISASGGKLTFGDGTTQTTAAATPNVGVSPTFSASNAGSASAPSFLFGAQTDSGLYLATTSTTAAVLAFTVNKTQSIAMSAAGVTVPGTLTVSGTSTFSGSATFGSVSMSSLSLSGNLTVSGTTSLQAVNATTLTTSGAITSGAHTVSTNGTASAPSFSFTSQTDTGMYLPTASTSAAVLGFAANGTLALNVLKGGITVPGTLGVTGASTLGSLSASALSVSGNETIGGTSTISGLLTASGNVTTPLVTTTQTATTRTVNSATYNVSNLTVPGVFGDGSSYPPSGISSDSLGNVVLNYQGFTFLKTVNPGYSSAAGNSPQTAFPTQFLSGNYQFMAAGNALLTMTATSTKFGFTSNTVPVTMQSLSGNILVLQNGGSSPSYTTTQVGNVDYQGNMTLSGNTSAVNGTFSGTLGVTGTSTLGVANTGALTSSGLVKGTALTISASGGKLTFGDGTSMTTAPTSGGSQAQFLSTGNGSASAPSYTWTNQTDSGWYLVTASTSAAQLGLTVNATQVLAATTSQITVLGTVPFVTGGATTIGGLLTCNNSITVAAGQTVTAGQGSVTTPAYRDTSAKNTGPYYQGSGTSSAYLISVNGTNATTLTPSGLTIANALTVSGSATHSGTTTLTGATSAAATITSTTAAGTASFVSTQGFKNTICMGIAYSSSSTAVNNTNSFNQTYITSSTNVGVQASIFYAPFPGSVIGIGVYDNYAATGKSYRFSFNGTVQVTLASTSSNGISANWAKNSYAFAANTAISMDVLTTTAGSQTQSTAYLIIEMGA